jgi:hypothetical protein
MSKFAKFGLFITLLLVAAMAAPVVAQGPQYVTFDSYNGDPAPRAWEEKIVKMWNDANPLMPVQESILAHEDFKQAIRVFLTAEPAPDVLTWFAGVFVNRKQDQLILENKTTWATGRNG